MMIPKPLLLVLSALYRLNRDNLPVNVTTIAITIGARRAAVACRISELHDLGLIDAERLRLTMAGLAVTAASMAPPRAVPRGGVRLAA